MGVLLSEEIGDLENIRENFKKIKGFLTNGTSDGLISGGIVTWSGTGLTFDVTAAYYKINGLFYNSPAGSITLDASDTVNDRLDVIALDNTGAIIKITGVPAANPEIPQIDVSSQLYLTAIFVQANATTPVDINQTVVYNENTEWTASAINLTANFNNTVNPFTGSKAIDITAASNGGYLLFVNSGLLDATTFDFLKFYIRLKATLANSSNINIKFFNGSTQVSNTVTLGTAYGFVKSTINTYQNISIPLSAFTFTNSLFDRIRITYTGGTFSAFYLDYIQLQQGISQMPDIVWGDIKGTLSNQTDLKNTLDLKADLVAGKVPASELPSTDSITEGATNKYFTDARVLAAIIAGISITNSAIINGDSVLSAFGKAQGQINYIKSNYLPLSGGILTGALTLAGDPTATYHAATKNYVDSLLTGISWKEEVRAATTSNITLSGTQTIDGIALVAGDRCLVKDQTTQADNGIYIVQTGAWTRATDADTTTEIESATVMVRLGTMNKDTTWTCSNTNEPVIGTDAITFVRINQGNSYTNGTYLSLTGNVFDINFSSFSTSQISEGTNLYYTDARARASIIGTTNRVTVTTGVVDIAATYIGQTSLTTLGTIATGTWNGTAIGSAYGGTGFTTYAKGDIIYASAINTLSKLAAGIDGQVLTLSSGLPIWSTAASGLPTQTGNSGKFLTTNGTNASWATVTAGASDNYAVASGTNTYTATITGLSAYTEGMSIRIKFTNANTGASTININSLGAMNIYKGSSTPLNYGVIASGQVLELYYDGTNFQIFNSQIIPSVPNKVVTTDSNGMLAEVNDLIDINSTTTESTLTAATWTNGVASATGVAGTWVLGTTSNYLYICTGTNTWVRIPCYLDYLDIYLGSVSDSGGVKTSAQMATLYPSAIRGQYAMGTGGKYEYMGLSGWFYFANTITP